MASIGRKITGVSSLLTATLSQTRRSAGKYRNHEHSAGGPCKIFNKIGSVTPRGAPKIFNKIGSVNPRGAPKIFNKIGSVTPRGAPELEHHKFFHATTSNVMNDNVNADGNSSSILDLRDEEKLFSGFTTEQLIDSLFRLNLICCQPMVIASSKYEPYKLHIFHAARAHFCAGENVGSVSRELHRIRDLGLKGILNYIVDDVALDNAACDTNLNHFLGILSSMYLLPPGSVSFLCVKITAICPWKVLERVSHLLRLQQGYPEFNPTWKEETLPKLDTDQEKDLNLAEQRLFRLCGACEAASLPLLVDAENTTVQLAIDYFVFRAFSQFNRTPGKPVVYGTVQAYLKDSLPRIIAASEEAKKRGITLGVKLVRGAYMNEENEAAKSLCVASALHSSIKETHRSYNACASLLLEKVAKGEASLLLATHNFESAKMAVAKAEELGIAKMEGGLQFAQLKGMADSLSLGLSQAGFDVSKLLPFGPIKNVMPYLFKMGEENKDMIIRKHPDMEGMRKVLEQRLKVFDELHRNKSRELSFDFIKEFL